MDEHQQLLRVHSNDLHEHLVEEVGNCFESQTFSDLRIRFKGGKTVKAHKLVLAAVSPFLKSIMEFNHKDDDVQILDLPDIPVDDGQLLMDVIYNGVVEATLEELRSLIMLARHLCIAIPVSNDLLKTLDIPPLPPQVKKATSHLFNKQQHGTKRVNPLLANAQRDNNLPGPLKRIRQELPHLSVVPNKPSSTQQQQQQQQQQQHKSFGGFSGANTNSKDKEYVCPFCNSKYNNVGNFKQHMKFHENEAAKEERNQMMMEIVATSFSPQTNLYTCDICKSTYSHPGNFKQHLGKHERESGAVTVLYQQRSGQGLSGVISSPSSATNNPLLNQSKSVNNAHLSHALQSSFADRVDNGDAALRRYHCEVCGRTFKHPGNFKQHMQSHMRMNSANNKNNAGNGIPLPPALLAGISSSVKIEKKQQQQPQQQGNSGKCDICDETLDSAESLKTHKSNAHGHDDAGLSNLFSCDQTGCFQSFSKAVYLAKHQETFHGIAMEVDQAEQQQQQQQQIRPTFDCRICGKAFFKMTKLTAHMKIHSAPEEHYRFPCDICGKKFTRPQHVTRHKMLHTGERPFSCDRCNKSFDRADKLRNHQLNCVHWNPEMQEQVTGHPMMQDEAENGNNDESYDDQVEFVDGEQLQRGQEDDEVDDDDEEDDDVEIPTPTVVMHSENEDNDEDDD